MADCDYSDQDSFSAELADFWVLRAQEIADKQDGDDLELAVNLKHHDNGACGGAMFVNIDDIDRPMTEYSCCRCSQKWKEFEIQALHSSRLAALFVVEYDDPIDRDNPPAKLVVVSKGQLAYTTCVPATPGDVREFRRRTLEDIRKKYQ